jgi:hypothetical protein
MNNAVRVVTWTADQSPLGGEYGTTTVTTLSVAFKYPQDLAVDKNGGLYVADTGNHQVKYLTPGGVVTVVAGTGQQGYANGASPMFSNPRSLALNSTTGILYVGDDSGIRTIKV